MPFWLIWAFAGWRKMLEIWPAILVAGMLCGIGAFLLMGLADVGWVFLLGIPLMALWGLSNPPIQAIMTHQVDPTEQGRLQGAITGLGSFAGIFGPTLFAQIFSFSISPTSPLHLPGLAFVVAAALLVIGTVIAARTMRHAADLATQRPADPLPCAAPVPHDLSPVAATHPVDPAAEPVGIGTDPVRPSEPSS